MTQANQREPELYRFEDDGKTPNNARLPLVLYCNVLKTPPQARSGGVIRGAVRGPWLDRLLAQRHPRLPALPRRHP